MAPDHENRCVSEHCSALATTMLSRIAGLMLRLWFEIYRFGLVAVVQSNLTTKKAYPSRERMLR